MANDVQYLIDMLYEMIDTAKTMPMARDKCVIVREDALDLLDDLRGQLPAELKKAQDLIRARDESPGTRPSRCCARPGTGPTA